MSYSAKKNGKEIQSVVIWKAGKDTLQRAVVIAVDICTACKNHFINPSYLHLPVTRVGLFQRNQA